jgi:hypothetical protein
MNSTRVDGADACDAARGEGAALDEAHAAAPQQTAHAKTNARRVLFRARAAFVNTARRRDNLHRLAS